MSVGTGVSILSQPNHPMRLAWLFASSIVVTGIIAAAATALLYIVQEERSSAGPVAPTMTGADIEAPEGLIVVLPVADAKEFKKMTGFAPFLPEQLPATTGTKPVLAVTLPDDEGRRIGRVSYSPNSDAPVEGITGPIVVLAQAKGTPGIGIDGELKRLTGGNGRAIATALPCGDLVIDVQMYFGPDPKPGEAYLTPYMMNVATGFIEGVKAQCAK